MNALATLLKSRFRKQQRSIQRETPDFVEPSVEETSVESPNQTGPTFFPERVSFLYSLTRRWAWPAVAFRCETHPEEASERYRDRNGDTLLHWACFGSPPIYAIQALLQACPELATVRNKKGCLPLHTACLYRANGEVIRALVRAYPKSAGVPIQGSKEECCHNAGSYPLHIMCDYGCRVESIKVILETPEGASSVEKADLLFRRTPLQLLNQRKNLNEFHGYIDELRKCRLRQRQYAETGHCGSSAEDVDRMELLKARLNGMDFWQKAELLVFAEHFGRALTMRDYEIAAILHAIVAVRFCPPSLLEFAVLLKVEDLLLPDENGELPLHVATHVSDESTISVILAAQPAAAHYPNQSGRFPLELYLRRNPDAVWYGALERLVSANPVALEALEIDRRLYPLIWSRLSAKKDINALFKTIRGNPSTFSERW
jgi:ankyrin repeat protein